MIVDPGLPLPSSLRVHLTDLHRLSEDELPLFADVVASFYEREGRDPVGVEYLLISLTVRLMVLDGTRWLH